MRIMVDVMRLPPFSRGMTGEARLASVESGSPAAKTKAVFQPLGFSCRESKQLYDVQVGIMMDVYSCSLAAMNVLLL